MDDISLKFKIVPFNSKWRKLRTFIEDRDLFFFYDIIHDGWIDRQLRIYHGEENPKYLIHWFPSGRCHTNVIFPVYILNKYVDKDRFKIITNDKHSAIVDIKRNVIYDPTYSANGCGIEETKNMFRSDYLIADLTDFVASLTIPTAEEILNVLENS